MMTMMTQHWCLLVDDDDDSNEDENDDEEEDEDEDDDDGKIGSYSLLKIRRFTAEN